MNHVLCSDVIFWDFTRFGRGSYIFFSDPSYPFHICWGKAVSFIPGILLGVPEFLNSRELTPLRKEALHSTRICGILQIQRNEVVLNVQHPGLERKTLSRKGSNYRCFCEPVQLLMLMTFWQFLVCKPSSKVKGNTWGLRKQGEASFKKKRKWAFCIHCHLPPALVEILQPDPPCPLSLVILQCGWILP